MPCFDYHGTKICIPLYLQVRQWLPPWWWPIFDNPRAEPADPSPWRWIQAENISDEIQRELATLTLISELAKTLTPERAKPIQAVLETAINPEIDLPKGMTFTL